MPENLNPVTMELGGKSPNIFMPSVMDADDEFFDKCLEGAVMFALIRVKFVPAHHVCWCTSLYTIVL
jgi:acyl-CoA reductase-like NAD-dependent aldehyde dehydrogenase